MRGLGRDCSSLMYSIVGRCRNWAILGQKTREKRASTSEKHRRNIFWEILGLILLYNLFWTCPKKKTYWASQKSTPQTLLLLSVKSNHIAHVCTYTHTDMVEAMSYPTKMTAWFVYSKCDTCDFCSYSICNLIVSSEVINQSESTQRTNKSRFR